MSYIRDWAAGLCVAGIGCSLLHLLCPAGAMRRVFSVLTAVFFFCCLLSPLQAVTSFAGELFSLPTQTDVPQALSEEVDEQIQQLLDSTLLADACSRVGEQVTVKAVTAIRDKSCTDSIYIERVLVTLDKSDHPVPRAVYTTLEQAWGVTVEVQYVG